MCGRIADRHGLRPVNWGHIGIESRELTYFDLAVDLRSSTSKPQGLVEIFKARTDLYGPVHNGMGRAEMLYLFYPI